MTLRDNRLIKNFREKYEDVARVVNICFADALKDMGITFQELSLNEIFVLRLYTQEKILKNYADSGNSKIFTIADDMDQDVGIYYFLLDREILKTSQGQPHQSDSSLKLSREVVYKAIISASLSHNDLDHIMNIDLGTPPESIVSSESFQNSVFQIVHWAESNGQLENLLKAAHRHIPNDPVISELAKDLSCETDSLE